ncbi:addiction module RelE/StbE family toxin [Scopulibacillus darangshiensis]|uniref:Addiction module RelE/StbE family toxin n=1 Tax=Scopulibacillus darangshiensis TaxID=442528 RepID=A0A4R2P364_9BACL|nr:type II toxin-antitoxin system RelE/ParE family toxin [Scopulibacillus darangshiensis]TCP29017.1 addiction module RelE/StbE family toxin [Scopulibacillus darangshiensis]
MITYNVVITSNAESDLQGIATYIAKELREPLKAQMLLSKIGAAIMDLEEMPLRHAIVSDDTLALQGIRKLIVDNYIVFYVVSDMEKTVTIIRTLLSRRNWLNLL